MRWYSGGIAEAINASKSKGAIFVVYIEGSDEKSQQITNLIDTNEIESKLDSDNFVAIKVEANSVPHQQFSEIYKQTPVPSIYFIGKNGLPLKIVTEAPDIASLSKSLDEVLEKADVHLNVNAASLSQNLINTEQSAVPPPNVVCENGVCTIKRDPEPSTAAQGDVSELTTDEKVERAKQLLEAKRLEREKEEKEKEKQKELERRKMGQEAQKLKQWQEDQELKQLKEEREKEKRLEKEARDRVLAQIAQDKADRATRFQPAASSTPTNKEPTAGPSTSRSDSNTALLQFKLPDGTSKTQEFPSYDKLESVINYIKANLNLPFKEFTLSTTFPRRQFTATDHSQTLADLQLTPNAVVLILPLNNGSVSTNPGPGGLSGIIWNIWSQISGIFGFIRVFLFGSPGQASGSSSGGRPNEVVHIRSKSALDNRIKTITSRLMVIDFYATWCGPCKMIAPELERMAKQYPNVDFLKVDVDENPDIASAYGVSSMPTFLFIKNCRQVAHFSGADVRQLRSTIERYK